MAERVVILAPHHDDVALFTAFNAIRYSAHIIVCLRSVKQEQYGIHWATREREEREAAEALGCALEMWEEPDTDPDWDALMERIRQIEADLIFAPAFEERGGGNEQHDVIGTYAESLHDNVIQYLTYTTEGKSTWGTPVEFEPAWVPMKLRALACHVSQASLPNCLPHFLRSQEEYVAP